MRGGVRLRLSGLAPHCAEPPREAHPTRLATALGHQRLGCKGPDSPLGVQKRLTKVAFCMIFMAFHGFSSTFEAS